MGRRLSRFMFPVISVLLAVILTFGCSLIHIPDTAPQPGNIILVIGDGMGFAHAKAASLYETGSETGLSFQQFPVQASMTTYALFGVTTDSAAAATAMATGHKVANGNISQLITGEPETLLEYYKRFGKRTGLVTTTYITHATPAAFGAHAWDRGLYDEIAADYLDGSRPNVLFGGGGNGMTPDAAAAAGYTVVTDREGLVGIDGSSAVLVSGQFGIGHLPYAVDGYENLPTLAEMTGKALEILEQDPDGFFLMVEGGRIDHASHGNDLMRMIPEAVSLSETVQLIRDWASVRTDTVIVVTADHETGLLSPEIPVSFHTLPDPDDQYWGSTGHSSTPVPLYAWGFQSDLFSQADLDNTDIYRIMVDNY